MFAGRRLCLATSVEPDPAVGVGRASFNGRSLNSRTGASSAPPQLLRRGSMSGVASVAGWLGVTGRSCQAQLLGQTVGLHGVIMVANMKPGPSGPPAWLGLLWKGS